VKLADRHCSNLNKSSPPLSQAKIKEYLSQLDKEWGIVGGKKIKRVFEFGEFMDGLEFVNKVAKISEKENHHPDIYFFYKKVVIELSTHAIGGLSENDFIVAAKIDRV